MYWSELTSEVRDGRAIYSPDVVDVDDDIIQHWIARSKQAIHPLIRARFADLAWEIGRLKKFKGMVTQDLPRRTIDAHFEAIERRLFNDESTRGFGWIGLSIYQRRSRMRHA